MPPSRDKAKKMLKEGRAQGKALTKKQKGYFGAIAGGNSTGAKSKRKKKRGKKY